MNPRRGPWIALLLLLLFAAATVWLPFAAALGLGALFMLASVALFRRPAWRNTALVCASLLAGLAGFELVFGLIVPEGRNADVVKLSVPERWTSDDADLGYRLRPGTSVEVTATHAGQPLYRVTYTIDPSGARATRGSAPDGPSWMFMGDSYVFGEGLADPETLPAQFAGRLQPPQHVVNLGVPGYAPNHLVRALETELYDGYVKGKVAAAIFWISPSQLLRVTGDGSWLTLSPHYELIPGEPPRYTGSFLAWRLGHPLEGLSYFARSRFAWAMRIERPGLERLQNELFIALLARLRDLVKEKWNAPLIVIYDWDDGTLGWQPQFKQVFDAIAAMGMPMVSMHAEIDPRIGLPAYTIPHDGHPSALMDREVARALAEKVRDIGLQ